MQAIDCIQGTEEWFRARMGIPTATEEQAAAIEKLLADSKVLAKNFLTWVATKQPNVTEIRQIDGATFDSCVNAIKQAAAARAAKRDE